MRKIIIPALTVILIACNGNSGEEKLTVKGEVKNFTENKVYLEQLFFDGHPAQLTDSASITNGKFTITTPMGEEAFYRLRFGNAKNGFSFIGDKSNITFIADANDMSLTGPSFSSPANESYKNFAVGRDMLMKALKTSYDSLQKLMQSGKPETDSVVQQETGNYNNAKEAMMKYCFKFADTAKSPILSLFACTSAPVEMDKFELPLKKLMERFPNHTGISNALGYVKNYIVRRQQAQQEQSQFNQNVKYHNGDMAPEFVMNDINDKPVALSSFKGKYVLVDFWASWCGPCRNENPNVVKAYNRFKNKNFTILGVSLDRDKNNWLKAIKDDGLVWTQVSDLKYWSSNAGVVFGFDAIPYNILLNPEGKIIATELTGDRLNTLLEEVLK